MRIALIHLTDIHFRKGRNPISDRVVQLATAINSVDPTCSLYLLVVSGDVAFSGLDEEYALALEFFNTLAHRLRVMNPSVEVRYVSIPGNHDCLLPQSETVLRDALIQGIFVHNETSKLGREAVLSKLLDAQKSYFEFHKTLQNGNTKWNGLYEVVSIPHENETIQLNLYNTALLSRRSEAQGKLHLPTKRFAEEIAISEDATLVLSVFHHSYWWLESNAAVSFRKHIEATSDIALCGHQHHQHNFSSLNASGERILYLEGGALQDEGFAARSVFSVLVFDFENRQQQSTQMKWSKDMYRRTTETPWQPLTQNLAIRTTIKPSDRCESFLSSLTMPFYHRPKGPLSVRDIFVYPNLKVRTSGPKPVFQDVRGSNVLKFVEKHPRIVFQASGFGGKTTLAQVLFGDLLDSGSTIPILLDRTRHPYLEREQSRKRISGKLSNNNTTPRCWRVFGSRKSKSVP